MARELSLKRTNSDNQDFVSLIKLLDENLAIRDGEDHAFYAQFNKIDLIKYVVVAYENGIAIGCGAIKRYNNSSVEIKRMFIQPTYRGKGFASEILIELESWAAELKFNKCILETGIKQPEAIALYLKNGYSLISNFGPYIGVIESKCFEKKL